jgi:hypothetical protein
MSKKTAMNLEVKFPEPIIPYPKSWTPEEFKTHEHRADLKELEELVDLINKNSGETTIDKFITKHPALLTLLMTDYSTGHHHAWVIPKKVIKTKIFPKDKGQIPDFLMAGKNSDGITWFVVELKGADSKIFSETKGRRYFSSQMNQGINQLMDYLNICDEDQSHLRDRHKLEGFKNPKGILVIGREKEFEDDEAKQKLKKSWNDSLNRINIRTFDWFKRSLEARINFIKNPPKHDNSFDPFSLPIKKK